METQLDLSIEFVSASQSGTSDVVSSGLVQTGDIVPMLIIFLTSILACCFLASFVCLRKKQYINIFGFGSNKNTAVFIGPVKYVIKSIFGMCALVVIACIVAAMLIVAALSTNFCTPAYAAGGGLTPSSNKIIGTVQDDGSVSFSTCDLTNSSDNLIKLKSASVEVAPEAKSIEALNSCVLAINAFDTCIYNGNPDGTEQTTLDSKSLEINEITPLSLDITNLDKQSTLDLCGKKVFKFKLTTIPITKYWLETDGNGLWKDGDLSINSIEVFAFEVPVIDGEKLTYIRPDGSTYIVTAVAKDNYQFSTCNFDEATKTYCANYVLAQSYKDSLCTEIAAISGELIGRISSCQYLTQDYKNQYAQEIQDKWYSVIQEIQSLNTKEDADAAVESAKSLFLDKAKIVFRNDLSGCASLAKADIEILPLLTNTYKTQVLSELSETSEEGVSQIDSQTSIADVYNVHNEYENKIKDYYNEANEFSIAKQAGLANVEASVAAANAQIDAAVDSTYLKQDEATAYRTTISDAAAEGKPAIKNADFPDDFQEVLNTCLGAINDTAEEATNLAKVRKQSIEDIKNKADDLLLRTKNSNWFNSTYINNLENSLSEKKESIKNTAMGTQDIELIQSKYEELYIDIIEKTLEIENLKNAKEASYAAVINMVDMANASIYGLEFYSNSQKQKCFTKVDEEKTATREKIVNSNDEVDIRVISIAAEDEILSLVDKWESFNNEKTDLYYNLENEFSLAIDYISWNLNDYLSQDDIEYFSQDMVDAYDNLYSNVVDAETSDDLYALEESDMAIIEACSDAAQDRHDKKESAQITLLEKCDKCLEDVEQAQLELDNDIEFYNGGINDNYYDFEYYIYGISPVSDDSDITDCLNDGIENMEMYSEAAKVIKELRAAAIEGNPERQANFDEQIDKVDFLTSEDISYIKASFTNLQNEIITDDLINMYFEWDIEYAIEVLDEEADVLIDDAKNLPAKRTYTLDYINNQYTTAVQWVTDLTYVAPRKKTNWNKSLQNTAEEDKAFINAEAHTTDAIDEARNDFKNNINITLRAAAAAQADGAKEQANNSNLYPLWQGGSGALSTYEYNRLMAEIQNIITTFNTQIGQMGDPSNIMNSTSGVTDAIERYGENGDLKTITITSESQNISFVYGEGAYQVNAGQFIVLGFEGDGFRVKVNHVGGNEVVSIKDNLGNSYAVGEDGYFTFNVLTDITTITASETE